jgi:hypothetical protein
MMRILIAIPALVVLLAAGTMYLAYGQIDPCRALAVERARRAEASIGKVAAVTLEPWTRLETSQLSTGQCTNDLLDSWGARLSHYVH